MVDKEEDFRREVLQALADIANEIEDLRIEILDISMKVSESNCI